MIRYPVSSSTIRELGYDADRQILEVLFVNGHLYQYFDVPEAIFQEMLRAGSAGQYLNANIKGRFRYARV
jgi:hypothetical protein